MPTFAASTVVFLTPSATIDLTKTKTFYGKYPLTLRKLRRALRFVLPRFTRVPCQARQAYQAPHRRRQAADVKQSQDLNIATTSA